jgi:hypothetical protein
MEASSQVLGGPHFRWLPRPFDPTDTAVDRLVERLGNRGLARVRKSRAYRPSGRGHELGIRHLKKLTPENSRYLHDMVAWLKSIDG